MTLKYTFDSNGNIYINNEKTNYMIYIDKDDLINFEKINSNNNLCNKVNNQTSVNFDSNKYDKIEKKNKLQVKAIEHAIEQFDTNEEFNKLNDAEDFMIKFGNYIYNPELKYYEDTYDEKSDINSDDDNDDDDDEQIIDDNIIDDINIDTKYNENFSIKVYGELEKSVYTFPYSNYECIIIDGDLSSTNILFRTQHKLPSYRITLFTKGFAILNIIGTKITTFTFCIDNDKIEINKITEKNIII
jgi:hypothetical protein